MSSKNRTLGQEIALAQVSAASLVACGGNKTGYGLKLLYCGLVAKFQEQTDIRVEGSET